MAGGRGRSGRGWCCYHADGPEGQQVVVLLAVAPGVPAGVLALLQDEHLTAEVHLLEAYKAEGGRTPFKGALRCLLLWGGPDVPDKHNWSPATIILILRSTRTPATPVNDLGHPGDGASLLKQGWF